MKIGVLGAGAVSPAGWGMEAFSAALAAGEPLPVEQRERPGRGDVTLPMRPVPKPATKLPFFRHPRLRRTSPIGRFIAGAALEALGEERAGRAKGGELRLGVVTTVYNACVNYSQRFYREVLDDPATASPIIFPETVFNAPSSHLSAMLGAHATNYTMIGDSAEFLCGLDLAAGWLASEEVDGCLVACGEELDWLTAEAMGLFERGCVMGEGAAALYLERANSADVELLQIAGPELITARQTKAEAVRRVEDALVGPPTLADDATRSIFGEGLGVSSGWQCLAAVERVRSGAEKSSLLVRGLNEHCAGAVFSGS